MGFKININLITLTYIVKLDYTTKKIDIDRQKIDNFALIIYKIVIMSFCFNVS